MRLMRVAYQGTHPMSVVEELPHDLAPDSSSCPRHQDRLICHVLLVLSSNSPVLSTAPTPYGRSASLGDTHTAVDRHAGPGDETRGRRGEKPNQAGDVNVGAHAAHRHAPAHEVGERGHRLGIKIEFAERWGLDCGGDH